MKTTILIAISLLFNACAPTPEPEPAIKDSKTEKIEYLEDAKENFKRRISKISGLKLRNKSSEDELFIYKQLMKQPY